MRFLSAHPRALLPHPLLPRLLLPCLLLELQFRPSLLPSVLPVCVCDSVPLDQPFHRPDLSACQPTSRPAPVLHRHELRSRLCRCAQSRGSAVVARRLTLALSFRVCCGVRACHGVTCVRGESAGAQRKSCAKICVSHVRRRSLLSTWLLRNQRQLPVCLNTRRS